MRPKEVLLAIANLDFAAQLSVSLAQDQYIVTSETDGESCVRLALSARFDALLLDTCLKGLDGFAVVSDIRRAGGDIPIMLLSDRNSITDIVYGLDCGAEDFINLPVSPLELSARVRALIRRGRKQAGVLHFCGLEIDPARRTVRHKGKALSLTEQEFRLLELLVRNAGQVVRRRDIEGGAYGHYLRVNGDELNGIVYELRRKIDSGIIKTVRGFGYRLG